MLYLGRFLFHSLKLQSASDDATSVRKLLSSSLDKNFKSIQHFICNLSAPGALISKAMLQTVYGYNYTSIHLQLGEESPITLRGPGTFKGGAKKKLKTLPRHRVVDRSANFCTMGKWHIDACTYETWWLLHTYVKLPQ